MTEDIVAMARAAGKDERLSDGALYGKLADEIERLQGIEAVGRKMWHEAQAEIERLNGVNTVLRNRYAGIKTEIEWLRAALQEIADADYLPDGVWAIDRAKRALEPKP
ncbi:MAG TPA: hypothetical protein VLL28_02595 [Hyphomicrobiaceae bacterium]|nr:hypothetical protein [Hyphomicrobiaceae bacterium]